MTGARIETWDLPVRISIVNVMPSLQELLRL